MTNEKLKNTCWNEVPESDTFCIQPSNMGKYLKVMFIILKKNSQLNI